MRILGDVEVIEDRAQMRYGRVALQRAIKSYDPVRHVNETLVIRSNAHPFRYEYIFYRTYSIMHFQLGQHTGGFPTSIACLFLAWTTFNIELCESASSSKVLALLLPDPGTDTQSVNLTSGEGLYYDVVCPPLDPPRLHDKDTVISAIERHRDNVAMARSHAETGIESPIFKLIFKSNKYRQRIVETFDYSTFFFTSSPLLQFERVKFICIRTEAEADAYRSQRPALWQKCSKPDLVLWNFYDLRTLFVCPQFFNFPDDSEEPQHDSCPAVKENLFAENAQGEQFKNSKTSLITVSALRLLDRRIRYGPPFWGYVESLNTVIGCSARKAVRTSGSYDLFISRGSNSTQNVILVN